MSAPTNPINKLITSDYQQTIDDILASFPQADDLIQRHMTLSLLANKKAVLFYIAGLIDNVLVQHSIIHPLTNAAAKDLEETLSPSCPLEFLQEQVLASGKGQWITCVKEGVASILAGDSLLLVEGSARGLAISTSGAKARSIDEPTSEPVIRGPRDGFTENILVNTALLRRRLQTPQLCLESMTIGEQSNTKIQIAYLHHIVKDGLIDELRSRLNKIKIDAVLESGYIEELIEDAPLSPFVTVQSTERPDKVAASLLEGRAAVFVDNTPFALVVPGTFWQYLQASDDYYSRYYVGSFFRLVRLAAMFLSLLLPSLYVLIVSFHQEMVPTLLALTIASGREVVPLPVLLEILFMEFAFELMREAGLRMPRPIGSAVSIVGSLVIGQAAVQAGIVGPFAVIIVAVTGIASFALPNYATSFSIRMLLFPLLIASGTAGLLGFGVFVVVLLLHMLSLRSFGEPYLAPLSPFRPAEQKDIIVRSPWWAMRRRPQMVKSNPNRTASHMRPSNRKADD